MARMRPSATETLRRPARRSVLPGSQRPSLRTTRSVHLCARATRRPRSGGSPRSGRRPDNGAMLDVALLVALAAALVVLYLAVTSHRRRGTRLAASLVALALVLVVAAGVAAWLALIDGCCGSGY